MKKIAYSLIGLSFAATTAYAQPATELPAPDAAAEAPADTSALPAPSDTAPAEPVPADAIPSEPADAGTAFSDAEIDSFAAATVKVQAIDADATLDAQAKQTQMAAAVSEAGLNPAKYNEIGQALATDTELRTKVQTAMARHAPATAG